MGVEHEDVATALQYTNGDLEAAVHLLTSAMKQAGALQ